MGKIAILANCMIGILLIFGNDDASAMIVKPGAWLRSRAGSARRACGPSIERQHVECGRKGEKCYSGVFFSDSCGGKLACKVEQVGLGEVWDDGVYGRCSRRPKGGKSCEKCRKKSGQVCYLPKMMESSMTELTVNVRNKFYTTCACFNKCLKKTETRKQGQVESPSVSPFFHPVPTPCKCWNLVSNLCTLCAGSSCCSLKFSALFESRLWQLESSARWVFWYTATIGRRSPLDSVPKFEILFSILILYVIRLTKKERWYRPRYIFYLILKVVLPTVGKYCGRQHCWGFHSIPSYFFLKFLSMQSTLFRQSILERENETKVHLMSVRIWDKFDNRFWLQTIERNWIVKNERGLIGVSTEKWVRIPAWKISFFFFVFLNWTCRVLAWYVQTRTHTKRNKQKRYVVLCWSNVLFDDMYV